MDHCTKAAKSLEDFQVLLEATGLFGTNKRIANFTHEKDANGDLVSPFSIHVLRKELQKMVNSASNPTLVIRLIWAKAGTKRLILVSKDTLAAVIREVCCVSVSRDLSDILLEAVGSHDRLQSNDLKERIAAIVSLLPSNDGRTC
jgi:hypothetical protein